MKQTYLFLQRLFFHSLLLKSLRMDLYFKINYIVLIVWSEAYLCVTSCLVLQNSCYSCFLCTSKNVIYAIDLKRRQTKKTIILKEDKNVFYVIYFMQRLCIDFAPRSLDIPSSKVKIGHHTDGKELSNSALYNIMYDAYTLLY